MVVWWPIIAKCSCSLNAFRPADSMDPPRFINHYSPLFSWLRSCGLPTPWLQEPSLFWQLLYLSYDTLMVIMVSYTLWIYIYSIATTSITFQDLCVLGISSSCYVCGLLLTLYHVLFGERLKLITDRMDSITETIFTSDLAGPEFFLHHYRRNANLMAVLTNTSLLCSFVTPFLYCWSVPFMDWLVGDYRANPPLPLVSPYNDKQPVVYELTVSLISCSIAISTAKKSATDCLFISLFNIQIIFLKYLSEAKSSFQKEFLSTDSAVIRQKLIAWTRLHQDILKNIENLIEISSSVIIIYSVIVINIVVCGAFVQVKKDNDNLIQSISIGSYVLITVLYHFLLSNTADDLSTQAQKLAFDAYNVPWFEMEKANADIVRMVLVKSNRPIRVTAFAAPIFMMNRETFGGFMVSAISAFVTFCQIKDRYA